MKGKISLAFDPKSTLEKKVVDLSVEYLSGGPAAGLPIQVRYQQSPFGSSTLPDFEGYLFSNGQIHEGMTRFRSDESETQESLPGGDIGFKKKSLVLNSGGSARLILDDVRKVSSAGKLLLLVFLSTRRID